MSHALRGVWAAGCVLAALLLAACGGTAAPLGGVTATPAVVRPDGHGVTDPIQLGYTLGRPATVTLQVQPPSGAPVTIRAAEHQAAGAHFVLFNGVVPTGATPGPDVTQVAAVLPDGTYHFTVAATPDGGSPTQATGTFAVQGAQTQPPGLENLQVYPATISPNSDAVADVAQISYRLTETSTTSVTLTGANGPPITVRAPARTAAGEERVDFNGQDLLGNPVADGTYTVTVRVEDPAGNAVAAQRPLQVVDAGAPSIAVRKVQITPPAIMLGGTIHVQIVVQNTGKVPLRTQGPDSGFTYTTNELYASIANGQYVDKAGLWRVGVDWQGNAGGAPYRYPFRWGFGQTLAPGATATITGGITILKQERTMWFYAGVLQEGVTIAADQLGLTPIQVSW